MKTVLSSRGLFLLGFLLLVGTNIVVLSGIALNRSGTPEAQLTLSERELTLPYAPDGENSGLSLRLDWRHLGRTDDDDRYSGGRYPAWLDADKVRELGYPVDEFLKSNDDAWHSRQPLSKEVFIVLEQDGAAYREAVQRAEAALAEAKRFFRRNPDEEKAREEFERAEKRLARERLEETRLFAVDAGLDPQALRRRYPDRSRYLLAKGQVRVMFQKREGKKEVFGFIRGLSVAQIHVPLSRRRVFDAIFVGGRRAVSDINPPRYEVQLAYGSRLEPWIISVSTLEENP